MRLFKLFVESTKMKILDTRFRALKVIKEITHYDKRGYFREILRNTFFKNKNFIFWCVSKSKKNVLRGLHIQPEFKQDKLVSVIKGKIFDVVLDLRKRSKTYGKHYTITLSDKNSTVRTLVIRQINRFLYHNSSHFARGDKSVRRGQNPNRI